MSEWCVDRVSAYDGPSPDDRPDSLLFGEWRRLRVTRGGAEGREGWTEESRVEEELERLRAEAQEASAEEAEKEAEAEGKRDRFVGRQTPAR